MTCSPLLERLDIERGTQCCSLPAASTRLYRDSICSLGMQMPSSQPLPADLFGWLDCHMMQVTCCDAPLHLEGTMCAPPSH
jgi:hypothetical protein